MNLKQKIREIPDWPEKGVNFKDITPLLQDIVETLGSHILGISFLIELDFLKGREKLKNYKINSLIHY